VLACGKYFFRYGHISKWVTKVGEKETKKLAASTGTHDSLY
jgi:hypothetical protein